MDIVLRGYLKYKSKGTWPKSWTKLWFILRSKSDGTKQLEYFDNEKKSVLANAVPKGVIDLGNVMLVQRLPEPDKKSQFMITFSGAIQYRHFDAPSEYNMEEWVTSLNSIIFSKIIGDVVFAVDMHKAEAISFHGPCEMILQEDTIMVRSRVNSKKLHQQQFQWNISHVKKFLAISDKHQLVIQVGRQSSTGPGEFVFTTAQSMQIMHGITAMLNEAKSKLGLNMPLTTPATIETHTLGKPITTNRAQSEKMKIAPYASKHPQRGSTLPANPPPYDKTQFGTTSTTSDGSYNVLSHPAVNDRLSVVSQPYDILGQSGSKHNSVALHLSPRVSPHVSPSGSRKSSYSSLNTLGSVVDDEYLLPPDGEDYGKDYGKLDHTSRPPELSPKTNSSPEPSQYGKLDHSRNRSSILPPVVTTTEDNQYGKLNHSKQPKTVLESQGQYGKLNHSSRTPEIPQGTKVPTVQQENEYGKLNHASRMPELPQGAIVQQENEYGRLNHSNQHAVSPEPQSEYGKLVHGGRPPELPPKRRTSQETEYGKLDCSKQYTRSPEPHNRPNHTNTMPESAVQENMYGKLAHINHHEVVETPINMQQSNYGQLDHTGFASKGKAKQIQPNQQDSSVVQQHNYQNQDGNFSSEAQYDKVTHKPPIAHRKFQQPSNSGKVSNPPMSDVPAGYATFKREHRYSISSSVSSYSSDVEDQLVNNEEKRFVVPNDDTGYSQLDPITVNTLQSTYDVSVKPKPKPRNI